jgi:hypothetical protein
LERSEHCTMFGVLSFSLDNKIHLDMSGFANVWFSWIFIKKNFLREPFI